MEHTLMFDVFLGATSFALVACGARILAGIITLFVPSYWERVLASLSKLDTKYENGVLSVTAKGDV